MADGRPTYTDPATGLEVMTATTLADRGWCCDLGCRHCPFVGTDDKAAWRAWARQVMATLDLASLSVAVRAGLRPVVEAAAAGRVLVYRALDHEVYLDPLIDELGSERFALTRAGTAGSLLTVHPAEVELERHRLGLLQPVEGSPELDLADLSAALVPGLAFDRRGTRMGHGLGHFDRLLTLLAGRMPLVGVTVEALVVPDLPCQDHDVAMDALATELGVRPTG